MFSKSFKSTCERERDRLAEQETKLVEKLESVREARKRVEETLSGIKDEEGVEEPLHTLTTQATAEVV